MKFNKQIIKIMILALLVPIVVNATTHTDEANEKNVKQIAF